jgi:hypothetical protein
VRTQHRQAHSRSPMAAGGSNHPDTLGIPHLDEEAVLLAVLQAADAHAELGGALLLRRKALGAVHRHYVDFVCGHAGSVGRLVPAQTHAAVRLGLSPEVGWWRRGYIEATWPTHQPYFLTRGKRCQQGEEQRGW